MIHSTNQTSKPQTEQHTKSKRLFLLCSLLLGYELYCKKYIYNAFLLGENYSEIFIDIDTKLCPLIYKSMIINNFPKPKEYINGISFSSKQALKELLKENERINKLDNLKWSRLYDRKFRKQVDKKVKKFLDTDYTTQEYGKNPISLRAKVEIDVNNEIQQNMVKKAISTGEDLFRFSAHTNCSKRCEFYQGKVCSMSMKGIDSTHFTGNYTENGEKIYSFWDIENQVDKWGYKNNIINGFNCFDKETKVLTNHGWKYFYELDKSDLVYTLDIKTKQSYWNKPINYFKKYYEGKMIHAKSYISDLMITPNHNVLYFSQFNKELRFREAKDIVKTNYQYAGIEWCGSIIPYVPVGDKKVESKLFCRLLGYWLADGSIHSNNAIKIAQQNNDYMWEQLQGLPFHLWRDKNKIVIYDKALHDLFKPLGNCSTKYIFNWVKELTKECLNELLEAFIYTDGYTHKPSTINGHPRKPHKIVFTTSKQLCADLCEIALKCGYRPKIDIAYNKGKTQEFKNGTYTMNYDLYNIHLNYSTNFMFKTIEQVDYKDYVYCVDTEARKATIQVWKIHNYEQLLWDGIQEEEL